MKTLVKRLLASLPFVLVGRTEVAAAPQGGEFTSKYVTFEIRHNEALGDFVVFVFPKNPYDCDRSEIFELIESDEFGGSTFQGGGSPGAPICARFPKAETPEQLRAMTRKAVVGLDKLMRDITDGVPIPKRPLRKIVDKRGKEWPECVPPDPSDPWARFNNNLNVNGTQYLCSAEGRWVVNEEAMSYSRSLELRRADGVAALTRRKLSHDELMRLNSTANVGSWETYHAAEKFAELYDLLLTQWELQTGVSLPIKTPLSRARGEYGRSPQKDDNRRAVEDLIRKLQKFGESPHD